MMVTNWHKHPKGDIVFGGWNDVTVTVNGDGTRTYSTASVGALFPFQNMSGTKITTSSFVVAVRFREARADPVGTLHCRAAQWGEGRYLGIQHDPRLGGGKYDVSGFLSGKGLSDPDRVGDLHARRLGGIAVNGSDVVRRGHDASSLALMGVMA